MPVVDAAATNTAAPVLVSTTGAGSEDQGLLAEQAQGHFTRAVEAQREGDWAAYGREITQLGDMLEQLQGTESQNSIPLQAR